MTKLNITDTTLRDAHQSLAATRMRTEDMLGLAREMEKAGFWSVEAWGGATFDTCIRYLNDDPWDRLRTLREIFVKTPIQMLLRGQNLVGYRHYPDDVVDKFVTAASENGISVASRGEWFPPRASPTPDKNQGRDESHRQPRLWTPKPATGASLAGNRR